MRVLITYSVTLLSYLLLATGTVLPIHGGNSFFVSGVLVLLLLVMLQSDLYRKATQQALLWMMPLLAAYLVTGFNSLNGEFLTIKIEGAFLATIFAASLLGYLMRTIGEAQLISVFLKVSLSILVMTILYKLALGFTDRTVRFFINGPIVFGWIMGMSAIIALVHSRHGGKANFVLFGCFSIAVLWTQSKGPTVALAIIAVVTIFRYFGLFRSIRVFVFVTLLIVLMVYFFPAGFLDRFQSIQRILTSSTTEVDAGSWTIRLVLWREAIDIWLGHPLFGIGPGNWAYFSNLQFAYPHNIFLEILVETGLVGLLGFVVFSFLLFWKTNATGKMILLFFFLSMSASGDISYLRFLLAFPICLVPSGKSNRTARGGKSVC